MDVHAIQYFKFFSNSFKPFLKCSLGYMLKGFKRGLKYFFSNFVSKVYSKIELDSDQFF